MKCPVSQANIVRRSLKVGFASLVVALAFASMARAEGRSVVEKAYPYTVVDQDIRDAVGELSRNLNIGVDMSEAVEGRLRGPWSSSTVEDFMDRAAGQLDIEWFFDGHRLHVSSRSESVRRLLPLGGVKPDAWQASLEKLGISSDRFPITIDADQDVALVSGPPKYVALIAQSLPKPKAAEPVGRVNVIYGRNNHGDAS